MYNYGGLSSGGLQYIGNLTVTRVNSSSWPCTRSSRVARADSRIHKSAAIFEQKASNGDDDIVLHM